MASFTCLSCHVAFRDGDTQREHFRSDWHRYNLKRKMGELPPVSAEVFREKVLASRAQVEESQKHVSSYCDACRKPFGSQKSYDNHMKSKKHLEMALQQAEGPSESSLNKKNKALALAQQAMEDEESEDEMEVEEVDDDEWEGEAIPVTDCIFCSHHSASLEKNLKHMGLQHTFFIPDLEFCHNLEGLVTYLGEKVGCGFECLWCSERGKRLLSLDAVQKHMADKGHCKMRLEGEGLLEYSDFYDYSTSYPDAGENNPDEEVDQDCLSSDAYELRLPSGVVIGHRSLQRYYKQKLNPNRRDVALRLPGVGGSHSTTFQNIMNQYRALGWNQESQADSARRARDLRYMQHMEARDRLSLGTRANKLQKNFRPQVNF